MTFRPEALRGSSPGTASGQVDFRLARNAVLSEFRKGRLSRLDVCDAHPELLRAARSIGDPVADACPICEEQTLVHVTYAFGPGLPASGRTVQGEKELAKLRRSRAELAVYVVEACGGCGWNHLARTFPLGGGRARQA